MLVVGVGVDGAAGKLPGRLPAEPALLVLLLGPWFVVGAGFMTDAIQIPSRVFRPVDGLTWS